MEFRVIKHEALDGSAAGASVTTGTRPEQGVKALVLIANGSSPIMIALRGPDLVDKKALKNIIGSKDIRFASADEVFELTNTEIGVIPAIGSLFNMQTYFDDKLLSEEEIAFGTGLRTKTVVMNVHDFVKATNPVVGSFTK